MLSAICIIDLQLYLLHWVYRHNGFKKPTDLDLCIIAFYEANRSGSVLFLAHLSQRLKVRYCDRSLSVVRA